MGTVSTTLPSDGQTIDAADVNTPINAILSEFNGNIDNDNIKSTAAIAGSKLADASITNAKLSTTAGEPGGAWGAWTPSWTNLTVGNGTLVANYIRVGKTVHFLMKLTFGSTTSIGGSDPTFSLPVTAADTFFTASGHILDSGTTRYGIWPIATTPSVVTSFVWKADTTNVTQTAISSTSPMTWTTGDLYSVSGTYEAA